MDTVRWELIQEIFHRATELPRAERASFLERECDGDAALLADVAAMIEEDDRAQSLLDAPLASVAHRVLNPTTLPAQEFGPYRVDRFLGEGGMGVVFLAKRADLDSRVALKVLRDAWLSPTRRERFEAEQRTLARFDHPSIARLLDAGTQADGTPWIAMEYVDGVSLTDHCHANASSLSERLRLLRDVCEAVQHAHRHAIIHRDLKPSNILVRADGTVKLLDFGVAKSLEGLDAPDQRTRTLWRLVTPAYAAPEQIAGGAVGVYTDVFALGVILHQLLADALPDGKAPSAVASAGRGAVRASKAQWADLDAICARAMHENPEHRYASVGALMRDLDHFRAGEPLEARPARLVYRLGKFVGRNRAALAVISVALVTLVVLAGVYGARLANARRDAVAEADRAGRIQRFMLSLFEGGDEQAAPPDSLRVVELIDRGVAQARLLDAEPLVQAELFETLGEIQRQLGRLDHADSLLGLAVAKREAAGATAGQDDPRGLVALGRLRLDQARYDEAESLIRRALESNRARLPVDHPDVVSATVVLGEVLQGRGAYEEAIDVLESVAPAHDSRTTPLELAEVLNSLANAHFYVGRYAESDSLNRRVLEITRESLGGRHPTLADNLVNLGATCTQRGEHVQAEDWYRQALAITRESYGDDHPKAATNRTMLGRALVAQERYDEAEIELTAALAVLERIHGPVHPRVASALNELGIAALMNRRFDEAEAHYRRTTEIYRSVYGDEHDFLGVSLSNLASVFMARKDWPAAEARLRDVVGLFGRTLSADHVNTGIARVKHGRTLLRLGRFEEARAESQTGLDVLTGKMDPEASWLRSARQDVQEASDSLAAAR